MTKAEHERVARYWDTASHAETLRWFERAGFGVAYSAASWATLREKFPQMAERIGTMILHKPAA